MFVATRDFPAQRFKTQPGLSFDMIRFQDWVFWGSALLGVVTLLSNIFRILSIETITILTFLCLMQPHLYFFQHRSPSA